MEKTVKMVINKERMESILNVFEYKEFSSGLEPDEEKVQDELKEIYETLED